MLRLVILLILLATLLPFDFQGWPPESGLAERLAQTRERPPHRYDAPGNFLLFLPFGLALTGMLRTRGWRTVRLLLATAGAGAAFSLGIESAQLFLPSRDPSVIDVLTNTLGALLGGVLAYPAGGRMASAAQRLGSLAARLSRRGIVVLLAAHLVLTLALPLALLPWSHRSLLAWDSTFPLLVANEADGSRPWRGTVWRLEFAARGLSAAEAESAYRQGLAAVAREAYLGGYELEGTEVRPQPPGALPRLAWRGAAGTHSGSGAKFDSRGYLASTTPPEQMLRRAAAADAFTLAAEFATADENQEGPARIVSNSVDENRRNFALGQWYDTLVFRLRTPLTGANGAEPELYLPGVCRAGRRVHVIVSFDGRVVRSWVDGRPEATLDLTMRPGPALLSRFSPVKSLWMQEYVALHAALVYPALGILWLLLWVRFGRRGSLLLVLLLVGLLAVAASAPFRAGDAWLGAGLAGAAILLLWPCPQRRGEPGKPL